VPPISDFEESKERLIQTEKWRLLDFEVPEDPAMNLAIDEAILLAMSREAAPPTVRFWRNANAVVVGYSQSVEAEVNLELCERENIQVVRRLSGGGAVYHDLGNINYTIVIDANHRLLRGLDIGKSYQVLCSGIVESLRDLDIEAVFRPLSDVFVADKKISGSAQSRKKGLVLHHGTLLVESNLDMLMRALDAPRAKTQGKSSTSLKKPVTRLRDELRLEVNTATLKSILAEGFAKAFSVTLSYGGLSSLEEETAQNLYRDKYSREEWNFWR